MLTSLLYLLTHLLTLPSYLLYLLYLRSRRKQILVPKQQADDLKGIGAGRIRGIARLAEAFEYLDSADVARDLGGQKSPTLHVSS